MREYDLGAAPSLQQLADAEIDFFLNQPDIAWGSGEMPAAQLDNGLNWEAHIRDIAARKGRVSILDLGSGDDCAAWTGGHTRNNMTKNRLQTTPASTLLEEGIELDVVAQTAKGTLKSWVEETGRIADLRIGHFYDALLELREQGLRFDAILSRHALYQSKLNIEALPIIDDLLTEEGAAFLDTVGKQPGCNYSFIYPKGNIPAGYLTTADIIRSVNLQEAQVGGLNWSNLQDLNGESAAWRKGQLQRVKMPILEGILPVTFKSGIDAYSPVYSISYSAPEASLC